MIDTLGTIVESASRNRIAKYRRISLMIARAAVIRGSLIRRCILSMLVLYLTISLTAADAHTQEQPASTPNATGVASGWWSPEAAKSATALRPMVSIAELTHFEASDLLRSSPAEPIGHLTEPPDGSIAGLPNSGLTLDTSLLKQALWPDPVALSPRSFLTRLQTKYTVWESSLADSRSLTNVNGVFVYPLLQINYASGYLPVTLYISPLRGSDAR
jgi:hypothetical protein